MSFPNVDNLTGLLADARRLRPDAVALSESAQLEIERLEHFTTPLAYGRVKLGLLFKLFPKQAVDWVDKFTSSLPKVLTRSVMVVMAARFRKPLESPAALVRIEN